MIYPWIPAILAVLGFLFNGIWTVLNVQMHNDVIKEIAAIKEDIAREYVSEKTYNARHADLENQVRDLARQIEILRVSVEPHHRQPRSNGAA